ncbi:MAG: tRNA (N6-threonylcarbamoyladenosine(37)-N6)-methyltransferase TrmO [Clostridia bacterium]|nr:tRNA (N6-threonylcarbamoyladenosine(37)-N6)-methyltransferase TrmO [Clostridia bacterium]
MKIIAKIKTDFPTKFGIPRQSGLVEELKGTVIFEPAYRNADAVRGLEDFSHIWLIWKFSTAVTEKWSSTVRPPKLGGNTKVGVFASRSPFRPNSLGLSSVRLESIEYTEKYGPILHVAGADLMDKTEIVDIKPYIPYADCHTDSSGGFSQDGSSRLLKVDISERMISVIPEEKRKALIKVLELDPRPAYQNDENRIYGFGFAGFEVRFSVVDDTLYVRDISKNQG